MSGKRIISVIAVSILTMHISASPVVAQTIATHPRTVMNSLELAEIKRRIANNIQPQKSQYDLLLSRANSAVDFTPSPPSNLYIPGGYQDSGGLEAARRTLRNNANPAYTLALAYVLSGDTKYADKSISILRAWANKNTSFSGGDAPLQLGSHFIGMIFAADLLQTYPGWNASDKAKFKSWWYARVLNPEYIGKVYTKDNNWQDHMLAGIFASGIAFNDQSVISKGIEVFNTYFKGDWKIKKDSRGTYLTQDVCRSGGSGCDARTTSTSSPWTKGLGYTDYAMDGLGIAADMARNIGYDAWEKSTDREGATIGGVVNTYHKWTSNESTFPWGGTRVEGKDPGGIYYEYANSRNKLDANVSSWLSSQGAQVNSQGEIWATLLKRSIKISLTNPNPNPDPQSPCTKRGDLDCNNAINALDITRILQYISSRDVKGDLDNNSQVNSLDVVALLTLIGT